MRTIVGLTTTSTMAAVADEPEDVDAVTEAVGAMAEAVDAVTAVDVDAMMEAVVAEAEAAMEATWGVWAPVGAEGVVYHSGTTRQAPPHQQQQQQQHLMQLMAGRPSALSALTSQQIILGTAAIVYVGTVASCRMVSQGFKFVTSVARQ